MKRGLLKILLLALLFHGECAATSIQQSTHYTTADGLAHNSVQGFCVDASGMLWICSWFALERFDGYRFECFRPEEGQSGFSRFKSAYLRDDGQILITTASGQSLLFSLSDYSFKSCKDIPYKGDTRFQHNLTDVYGNRWEEATVGVRFTPHKATNYALISHEKYPLPRLFFEDSAARLWISWGGQSPIEYLKECRLQYATELLLRDVEKTVAAIAYESGFSTPQYFSNVFRKRYHMTPNEWRKCHLTEKCN